jgi:SAM-dependent methyltransferase
MNQEVVRLQEVIDQAVSGKQSLKVLEAGCGSSTRIRWDGRAKLVGIDISEKQLRRNEAVKERIVGDLQTYRFPPGTFDAIVCWDVLEHLSRPKQALENFRASIRADGIIILAMPNVRSLKGLFTKCTPFSVHVWFYRHLFRKPLKTGTDDMGPFPTFLRFSISPDAIQKYARRAGLTPLYLAKYESSMQRTARQRIGISGWRWRLVKAAVKIVSVSLIDAEASDYIIVLAKNGHDSRAQAG